MNGDLHRRWYEQMASRLQCGSRSCDDEQVTVRGSRSQQRPFHSLSFVSFWPLHWQADPSGWNGTKYFPSLSFVSHPFSSFPTSFVFLSFSLFLGLFFLKGDHFPCFFNVHGFYFREKSVSAIVDTLVSTALDYMNSQMIWAILSK